MRTVSRFESNLLKIVYCVFGNYPVANTHPAVRQPCNKPVCLSRDTVELVEAAIAKGITQKLATDCGWKNQTFLRNEKPKTGRVWERTVPSELGLSFSKHSLDFLVWVTTADLSRKKFWREPNIDELTLGDQFLLFSVIDKFSESVFAQTWRSKKVFRRNGLYALMNAHRVNLKHIGEDSDFEIWTSGEGSLILEAMQGSIANRWIEMEQYKTRITSVEIMNRVGRAQERVLGQLMEMADKAGRRDLCRFLLSTFTKIFKIQSELKDWTRSLKTSGLRIADRTEAYRNATALLRQGDRLQKWHNDSVSTGYMDENYAATQLWKSDWERLNVQPAINKAQAIVRETTF
ncbi:MAG: hypothetical protein AB8B55_13025 [Mariniblastus sp.]